MLTTTVASEDSFPPRGGGKWTYESWAPEESSGPWRHSDYLYDSINFYAVFIAIAHQLRLQVRAPPGLGVGGVGGRRASFASGIRRMRLIIPHSHIRIRAEIT